MSVTARMHKDGNLLKFSLDTQSLSEASKNLNGKFMWEPIKRAHSIRPRDFSTSFLPLFIEIWL